MTTEIEITEADMDAATITISHEDLLQSQNEKGAITSQFSNLTQALQGLSKASIDVILLVDTSGSMGAGDYKPNRLEAAKEAARSFARRKIMQNYNDRVGIIGFGGQPRVVHTLSSDLMGATAAIDQLKITHTGTMIGNALRAAYQQLQKLNSTRQGIVLLSDGGDKYDTSQPLSIVAKYPHVKVFTIGMGTRQGGVAKLPHGKQHIGLNETLLRQIAANSGGEYSYAADVDTLRTIYQKLADV